MTLKEMRDKIRRDLDLEEEDFITDIELDSYINFGIKEAEAEIHSIYEDYFLTHTDLSVTAGTDAYSLPSDIYANKIRILLYHNSDTHIYPVQRIRRLITTNYTNTNDDYRYLLTNTTASGTQMKFYPTIRDTSTDRFTLWYIRNATQLSADSDSTDIPEFESFILLYAKIKCLDKDKNPSIVGAKIDFERERALMVETLTNMVDDNNTHILMDASFYNDFYNLFYGDEGDDYGGGW